MAIETLVQQCDSTVTPVTGCNGCELWDQERQTCFAAKDQRRYGEARRGYSPSFNEIVCWPGRMGEAAKWPDLCGLRRYEKPWLDGLPRLIFVSEMGEALSGQVSFGFLRMEIIDNVTSPHGCKHLWFWLTKRPGRMAEFSRWLADQGIPWPENLWAGTSITTKETAHRIEGLLQVGDSRTLRMLSVEPQLEPLNLQPWLPELDWVVQGGESGGSQARKFDTDWAKKMRKCCRKAGTPFFLKQFGSYAFRGEERLRLLDDHGADWTEWPEDLRVRQMPVYVGQDKVPGIRQRKIEYELQLM